MANPILNAPHFHSEKAAFAHVEALLWPNGPVCPHCKAGADKIGRLEGMRSKQSKKHPEGVERHGLRKCYACGRAFTVRVGSIFEDSHLPLHLWLQAIHLLTSSKKGISTRHIQRLLNCSMKTAWFLTHRIREIMKPDTVDGVPPLGGHGVVLEADEVHLGAKAGRKKWRKPVQKQIVMSLVERGGEARSVQIPTVRAATLRHVLFTQTKRGTKLMTDEANIYGDMPEHFASHGRVAHGYGEYVRGENHTNSVEGFFSILRRGMYGTYQHVSEAHLHRYLAEFDYRYTNREKVGIDDKARASIAVMNAKGRRLTYETTR